MQRRSEFVVGCPTHHDETCRGLVVEVGSVTGKLPRDPRVSRDAPSNIHGCDETDHGKWWAEPAPLGHIVCKLYRRTGPLKSRSVTTQQESRSSRVGRRGWWTDPALVATAVARDRDQGNGVVEAGNPSSTAFSYRPSGPRG